MITLEYLRSFRIGGYAIFDLVVSFVGIYLLAPLLSKICRKFSLRVSTLSWLFLTLPISIVVHLLVGQKTLMVQNFLDLQGHWEIKSLIIILVILGTKNIQKIKV
jgi:hypothetical protein